MTSDKFLGGYKKSFPMWKGLFIFAIDGKNRKSKIIYGKNFCDHVDPLWNLHIGIGDDYGRLVEWFAQGEEHGGGTYLVWV